MTTQVFSGIGLRRALEQYGGPSFAATSAHLSGIDIRQSYCMLYMYTKQ